MYTQKLILAATVSFAAVSLLLSSDSPRRHDIEIIRLKDDDLELLPIPGASGPESITFDPIGGGPYTGVSDGRILKWRGAEGGWLEYASSSPHLLDECRGSQDPKQEHECGRPLGLQFNERTGELYVADAYLGLRVVEDKNKSNGTRPIATQAQGLPFRFTNSLDIDQDSGVIYFTDSSTRFQRREFMSAIISGDKTGRLMKYDPKKNEEIQVLADSLSFPNGLALSKNGSFLFIVETTTCRILRYWIHKPHATTPALEVVTQLPGFPDNIKRIPCGGFWVALHSKRGRLLQWALSLPWLRKVLLRVPFNLQKVTMLLSNLSPQVIALKVSEEGDIVGALQYEGRYLRFVSEVKERHGKLWIGSVIMPFLGVYRLQGT